MSLVQILPLIAALGLFAFGSYYALAGSPVQKGSWAFPAALSAALLSWSLVSIVTEGPFGFWTEHTRNLWGNQIWFDLLLATGIAWTLIVPRAKSLGMRLFPWFVFVLCSGSIGFLAMMARYLYLRDQLGGETGAHGQAEQKP